MFFVWRGVAQVVRSSEQAFLVWRSNNLKLATKNHIRTNESHETWEAGDPMQVIADPSQVAALFLEAGLQLSQ
jgi:hypothetical protein